MPKVPFQVLEQVKEASELVIPEKLLESEEKHVFLFYSATLNKLEFLEQEISEARQAMEELLQELLQAESFEAHRASRLRDTAQRLRRRPMELLEAETSRVRRASRPRGAAQRLQHLARPLLRLSARMQWDRMGARNTHIRITTMDIHMAMARMLRRMEHTGFQLALHRRGTTVLDIMEARIDGANPNQLIQD